MRFLETRFPGRNTGFLVGSVGYEEGVGYSLQYHFSLERLLISAVTILPVL